MSTIIRYVVAENPHETGDGDEYDDFDKANETAKNEQAVVLERVYVYDDEVVVADYRKKRKPR